jgi:F0F1-type ATP synthase membrane subunit c/vacuolar-type H+-ATPase subunit K
LKSSKSLGAGVATGGGVEVGGIAVGVAVGAGAFTHAEIETINDRLTTKAEK